MVTPEAIDETLDLIVEECGEVVVARSKLRRFGPDSRDPAKPDSPDNMSAMITELLDVHTLIGKLIKRCIHPDLTPGAAERHAGKKIAKIKAHHPSLEKFL
jgi:NTP pyrophosphatase (non-canonical NTP hydrolase)